MKRYTLVEKATGKVILDLPYETAADVKEAEKQQAAAIQSVKTEVFGSVKEVPDGGGLAAHMEAARDGQASTHEVDSHTNKTVANEENQAQKGVDTTAKIRKPRSDKGETRGPRPPRAGGKGVGGQTAKKRDRGIYVVLIAEGPNIRAVECADRFTLTKMIEPQPESAKITVYGDAHKLDFKIERRPSILTLKPAK